MTQEKNMAPHRKKNSDRYDHVSLQFPKGTKNILKRLVKEQACRNPKTNQCSVNQLIVEAIEKTYHINLSD